MISSPLAKACIAIFLAFVAEQAIAGPTSEDNFAERLGKKYQIIGIIEQQDDEYRVEWAKEPPEDQGKLLAKILETEARLLIDDPRSTKALFCGNVRELRFKTYRIYYEKILVAKEELDFHRIWRILEAQKDGRDRRRENE